MDYKEGQTATNPKTGQKVVFKGGQWVNAGAGGVLAPRKPSTAEVKQDLNNKAALADLVSVERQVGEVEKLYNQNFKGVGPGSLLEYLPTPARKQFDAATNALSPVLKPLIRGPGEGTWSDGDQRVLEKLIPDGGSLDADIEQRIKAIRGLIGDKKLKHGGAEATGWKVTRTK
jgi:hypothetical protein